MQTAMTNPIGYQSIGALATSRESLDVLLDHSKRLLPSRLRKQAKVEIIAGFEFARYQEDNQQAA